MYLCTNGLICDTFMAISKRTAGGTSTASSLLIQACYWLSRDPERYGAVPGVQLEITISH